MDKQFNFVYKTINTINNKIYVGRHSTHNIDDGYIGSGLAFMRAIKKHGKSSFKREIIEHCNSFSKLCEREEYWIKELNAIKEGYNMTNTSYGSGTGENNSFFGKKHSEASKIKMRESTIGKKYPSLEYREKLSKLRMTENLSSETLRRKKESVMGEKNPFFGKKHSEETKAKLRKANRKKRHTNESRKKISNSLLNRPKIPCKYCGRIIGGGNINKHELYCSENPDKMIFVDETVTCPYCGRTGGKRGMNSWHFNNCKHKNKNNESISN